MSVAIIAATFMLADCGGGGGTSGTGGSGGKNDSGLLGNGGSTDAAPVTGTGGSPGTGGMVDSGGLVTIADAGMDGSVVADVKLPSVDMGVEVGIVPVDTSADLPITPDTADAAPLPSDVAIISEVGSTDVDQPGGTCPAGKWDKMIDLNNLTGLAADKDGNLFAAMTTYKDLDLGSGPMTWAGGADLVIARLNPSTGVASWAKIFGDDKDQNPTNLAIAKSGQVGVIGTFVSSMTVKDTIVNSAADAIDFAVALDGSGNELWAKAIDTAGGKLTAIASNPAQDAFAVCGYSKGAATSLVPDAIANSDGNLDILVAKLDATTGAVIWSRQIGGAGRQYCQAVAMDAAGNVFISGIFNGTLDFGSGAFSPEPSSTAMAIWAAKLASATGATSAAKQWGNNSKQVVRVAAIDDAGNLAIAGQLKGVLSVGSYTMTTGSGKTSVDGGVSSTTSNIDAFVIKLDNNLNPLWARNWGDSYDQDVRSAGFDSQGDLIVAGSMVGTIDLGNGQTLVAATGADSYNSPLADMFWMKLRGDTGAPLCGQRYGDDFSQEANLVAVSRATSGAQVGAVTLSGTMTGVLDFGLASGALVAGTPGTLSGSTQTTFLYHVAP